MDGDIKIYILSGSKNNIWQVRFRNPLDSGGHYIRKSTGYKNKEGAIRFALDLYNEYSARKNLGLSTGRITLGQAIFRFKNEFDKVGKLMLVKAYETYWKDFFGDRDLAKVRTDDIHQYFKWRVKNAKSLTTNKAWNASGKSVSVSTLKLERNLLRRTFNFCKSANLILNVPSFPRKLDQWSGTHSLPTNKRRARLTDDDYQKVVLPYLNMIERCLKVPKWKPQLQDPTAPPDFQSRTNLYESRLKTKNSKERGRDTHKIYCHQRVRYDYAMFWFFTTLILNSGVRPSEVSKLKNKDIQLKRDKNGLFYTIINIDRSVSKVRKHRQAICRDFGWSYERYLRFVAEKEYRFNKSIDPEDWLFPSTDGKNFYRKRREKYLNTMRRHFKRMGLHIKEDDSSGVKTYFSAYSFRAFYITMRLRNGIGLYELSKQVGTSPKTILSQYDGNENWSLRDRMVAHLEKDVGQFSDKAHDDLKRFATDWD